MNGASAAPLVVTEGGKAFGSASPIEVAVAALWRETGGKKEVLVTRRQGSGHLAGSWELPGGKLEPGESAEAAARREAAEEAGLSPADLQPLVTTDHTYEHLAVRLHAFIGRAPVGAVVVHRRIDDHRWVAVRDLASIELPPANGPITAAIIRELSR